jgi:hypothetical protein
MPLEGHWERQNTPLRALSARERRMVVPIALIVVVATLAAVLYLAIGGSSGSAPGCLDLTTPSTMGAGNLHACGHDAARWCRTHSGGGSTFSQDLREQCRRAGYL